jgi:preprotein translocase subunit SecA
MLSVLDRKWREHLYEMDYLKEGIGLRAMAQRDPLVEYQREGYQLFNAMTDAIKEETIGYLFNLEVQVEEAPSAPAITLDSIAAAQETPGASAGETRPAPKLVAKGIDGPGEQAPLQYSAPSVDGDGGVVTRGSASGKNGGAPASSGASADGATNREERRKAAKQQRKR